MNNFNSRVTKLAKDKDSDHLANPMEHESVRQIKCSIAHPILIRGNSSLVPSLIVVVAVDARNFIVLGEAPVSDRKVKLTWDIVHVASAQAFSSKIVGFSVKKLSENGGS